MFPHSYSAEGAWRADLAACRSLLRGGSRSFYAASFLLPRRVREPASALYAFCRIADDAIDLDGSAESLRQMHARLDRAYRGQPDSCAVDRAFAATVARYAIPRALPEALFEGFAWDAENRRYEVLDDLQAYGARVAGSVGAMMALLMDARDPRTIARACDLGVAMQLTNIARDVGEDARAGRLYLPMQWLREAGIDPHVWLRAPKFDGALATVVERLLLAAERLYWRADIGITHLPRACRPGIGAARYLYAEIGHHLQRNGLDSVSKRAAVPPSRKAALLLRAVSLAAGGRRSDRHPSDRHPCLAQTAFLVDAVAADCTSRALRPGAQSPSRWNPAAQAVWVLELFERLERRDRLEGSIGKP